MKIKAVPSKWLEKGGRRLDCGPYLSGAIEARVLLEKLPTEHLYKLTLNELDGIYNGPQFIRNYVHNLDHGVPFLTTSSMLRADLSTLPLLKKKDAYSPKLKYLQVEEGMTLITCSGTIGRTAYTRKSMQNMWSNQDILKVVPNPGRVLSGYLYAYLSSKFGIPLVVSGTYGAVIQHIEPQHIADLPVPRFGETEKHAHDLVLRASDNLTDYQALIDSASNDIILLTGISNPTPHKWYSDDSDLGFTISSKEIAWTLRALNHSRRAEGLKQEIKSGRYSDLKDVIDLDWLRWRMMFKRIIVDQDYGIETITQKPLFNLFPEGKWISRQYLLNHSPRYVVPDETILIAKQGTLGENELYCRCEFITGNKPLARAYSDHCMRVVVKDDKIHPGYLFAFLRSNVGFRLLRSLSEGSKQQDLHWRTVPSLPIPRCDPEEENEIGERVRLAYRLRNEAVDLLSTATELVEQAIREGGR